MAPDARLLERWVRDRDADAFAQLVARYSGLVYGTCRRILGNATEAEDVAQEAFIELATRGRAVTTSIGSWLHTVATHRALNHIRSEKRRVCRERLFEAEPASADAAGWDEVWQHVDEAIAALPEKYRAPIVLRFIEGRTQDFIARELDMPPATVRYRLARGVEEIRKTLRGKGVGVSLAVLGGALAGMESTAAPASLTAVLGRMALAGLPTPPAAGKLALIGGVAMTTKKAVTAACAVLVLLGLGGVMIYTNRQQPLSAPEQTAAPAPVKNDQTRDPVPPPVPEKNAPAAATPPTPESVPAEEAAKPPAPTAAVQGIVLTTSSLPLSGASIDIEVLKGGVDREVERTYSAVTGADGRYRVESIDTLGGTGATASVYACAPGFLMQKKRQQRLAGGGVTRVDFNLQEAKYIVAGTVVAQNRAPLPQASVELQYYGYNTEGLETTAASGMTTGAIGDCRFVFARTDDRGRFELAIPGEGLCDFTVRKDGYGPGFFPQIPTGTRDAVFTLRAPGGISGHVKYSDGKPAPGIPVEILGAGFPGGLDPFPVWIQPLLLRTVRTTSGEDGSYAADGLGDEYWYRVAVPVPGQDDEAKVLAQAMGVRVQAGKTTSGVDLVLPAEGDETVIYGEVTDIVSGKAVYPMAVDVLPVKPDVLNGMAETIYSSVKEDGTFRIVLNIMGECDVICRHRYETEGGGVWWDPEGQTIRIKPYEQKEVNFTVAAPFNVELEYVDESGAPLAGIMTAMRRAEGSGGCGGSLVSGPDGRATMHGLPPGIPLVAMGWQDFEDDTVTIGSSEPFTGGAGQDLTGVRVVCRPITGSGSVSATLIWPDGSPVAQIAVYCRVMRGGSMLEHRIGVTAADGSFASDGVLPEGVYPEFAIGFEDDQGRLHGAIVNDVTIANGQTTPLGTLTVVEAPPQ